MTALRRPWIILPLLAFSVAVASCDDEPAGPQVGPPAAMVVISGNAQRDTVGQELPGLLVVQVEDENGIPVAGQLVNFVVVSGGGSVFAGSAITNGQGRALERWTLGTVAGDTQRVEARAIDPETGAALVFAVFEALGVPDAPTTLVANPDTAAFDALGDTIRATAAIADRFGNSITGVPVDWRTSDSAVALVDSAGLIEATGNGVVSVIADLDGLSDTVGVHVAQQPFAVSVQPASDTLNAIGDTTDLSVQVFDRNGYPIAQATVSWTSLDAEVASVDQAGRVVGLASGMAGVMVLAGLAADTASVLVRQIVATFDLLRSVDTLRVGTRARMEFVAADSNGVAIVAPAIQWTTSGPAVTVDSDGRALGATIGDALVRATAGGVADSVSVAVRGAQLSFLVGPLGDRDIYRVDLDGTNAVPLSATGGDHCCIVWSPDGRYIAFGRQLPSGRWRAYRMDADGSDELPLTTAAYDALPLGWSPDGETISLAARPSTSADYYQLHVLDVLDGTMTPISSATVGRENGGGVWSPTGDRIAYSEGNQTALHVVAPNGSADVTLAAFGYNPSWSPDGQWLVYSGDQPFIIDRAGATTRRDLLGHDATWRYEYAEWSPVDDRIVVHARHRTTSLFQIAAVNADGSGFDWLSDGGTEDLAPVWSPDGQWIAFGIGPCDTNGCSGIAAIHRDGTDRTPVSSLNAVHDPSGFVRWRP